MVIAIGIGKRHFLQEQGNRLGVATLLEERGMRIGERV
jgi:hypothetical protein